MTNPNDDLTTPQDPQDSQDSQTAETPDTAAASHRESVLDSLREVSKAFQSAGSALGDVMEDFAARYRNRANNPEPHGAHAVVDQVDEQRAPSDRLKTALADARERLGKVDNVEDAKKVTAKFAGHLEDLVRDMGNSVRAAVKDTRNTEDAKDAKAALEDALATVRKSFDEATDKVREGIKDTGESADSFIDDLKHRLETMVTRARIDDDFFEQNHDDVIDGEVVEEN